MREKTTSISEFLRVAIVVKVFIEKQDIAIKLILT